MAIKQDWSKSEMINSILNSNGGLIEWDMLQCDKRPLYFEFEEIKKTLSDFIEMSSVEGQGMVGGWLSKIRKTILHYNIYGRIVTKKRKGCSYFYDLLNINAKNDGWIFLKQIWNGNMMRRV